MADEVTEQEIKRREYELKKHDFLLKLYEAYHERIFKVTTAALAGNIGALVLFATISKAGADEALLSSLKDSVRIFLLGILFGSLAVGAGWAMSIRKTEAFERLVRSDFSPDDDLLKDQRNALSRAVSHVFVPYMAVFGAMISALFFLFGILAIITRAA